MEDIVQIKYALDTFYFLICGALVMWMAASIPALLSHPARDTREKKDEGRQKR